MEVNNNRSISINFHQMILPKIETLKTTLVTTKFNLTIILFLLLILNNNSTTHKISCRSVHMKEMGLIINCMVRITIMTITMIIELDLVIKMWVTMKTIIQVITHLMLSRTLRIKDTCLRLAKRLLKQLKHRSDTKINIQEIIHLQPTLSNSLHQIFLKLVQVEREQLTEKLKHNKQLQKFISFTLGNILNSRLEVKLRR